MRKALMIAAMGVLAVVLVLATRPSSAAATEPEPAAATEAELNAAIDARLHHMLARLVRDSTRGAEAAAAAR